MQSDADYGEASVKTCQYSTSDEKITNNPQ